MIIENKFGKVEIENIPDDEPIFILRAKDVLAYSTIMSYQSLAVSKRCSEKFIDELDQLLERFAQWAEDNAEKMKIPD